MRALTVVVSDVFGQYLREMITTQDEELIEALSTEVSTNRSANAFARGARTSVLVSLMPSEWTIWSKLDVNFVSLSRMRRFGARAR
jgi:hypothetical protein